MKVAEHMDALRLQKEKNQNPFYTIGHSTRSLEEFAQLLKDLDITIIIDVRTMPRSRTNPQYNTDTIATSLQEFGIEYRRAEKLGGLRKKSKTIPPETNAFWENKSFHNYADYAMSEEFREGLAELIEIGHQQRCVYMCSEVLWWRCHRRIISDYLLAADELVFHIIDEKHIDQAHLTKSAHLTAPGILTYPPEENIG
jgi:uncharacterized protein (DUF488 family)